MPDTDSITIVKESPYRGQPEEWSNTYHLDGTTPGDATAWYALANAIVGLEKALFSSTIKFVRAYGYVAGDDHAAWVGDYAVDGRAIQTGTLSSSNPAAPGDAAMTCRWNTGVRNTHGKYVYLRKYFHGVHIEAGSADTVDSTQIAAMVTLGGKMTDGTLPGGNVLVGPQGAPAGVFQASPWITTRTLKRRGKRNPH